MIQRARIRPGEPSKLILIEKHLFSLTSHVLASRLGTIDGYNMNSPGRHVRLGQHPRSCLIRINFRN